MNDMNLFLKHAFLRKGKYVLSKTSKLDILC
jgi:hypothetical protein